MRSLTELVAEAQRALADLHRVDAGLDGVVAAIDEAGGGTAAAAEADRRVRTRIRALQAAGDELEQLRHRLEYMSHVLPFHQAGWAQLERELSEQLAADPSAGLATWLEHWFDAAAGRRLGALERLGTVELPRGAALIRDRCAASAAGLAEPSWRRSSAVLEAGVAGLQLGERTVPSPAVRERLSLLLARLAIHDRRWVEAERALEAAGPSPAARALRVRLRRHRGGGGDEERDLLSGESEASVDLDVAVELIAQQPHSELALDIARGAVRALPVLNDIDGELARLVEALPGELWAAIAERAWHDGERDLFVIAAGAAEAASPVTAFATLGMVAELRAAAAEADGDPPARRAVLLATAGANRLHAQQFDAARELLERAQALDPRNLDAALLLADCLVARSFAHPLAETADDLLSAIGLIAGAAQTGAITERNSWSFLTESAGRRALAGGLGFDRDDELWRAVLAAAEALTRAPGTARRWAALADALAALGLPLVALTLAAHAVELDRHDPSAIGSELAILTNAGRFQAVLARIQWEPSAYYDALRGYIAAVHDNPFEAVRTFRATTIDPNAGWIWQAFVRSLLLADRASEACEQAERVLAHWRGRVDEYRGARTVALMLLILGRPEEASSVLDALPLVDAPEASLDLRGAALVLRGEEAEGLALLARSVRAQPLLGEVRDTRTLLQLVRVLATRDGLAPPATDAVEQLIEERDSELSRLREPLHEFISQAPSGVDPDVVERAKQLVVAAVRIARDQTADALVELGRALAPGDGALQGLRAWASGAAPAPPAAEPAGSPATEPAGRPITLELPRSWFGQAPVSAHPLGAAFIPGAAAVAGVEAESIRIDARRKLEPDRFRILVGGEVADEGALDPASRYARADALALLDADLQSAAVHVPELGLWRLPPERGEASGLAGLLIMTAAEAVAWRIVAVAPGARTSGPASAGERLAAG